MHELGAIVLAGGQSSRMGSDKAALDWHGTPLLRRVTGVLTRAVSPGPVIVVGAPGQALPGLAGGVEVVSDERPGRGPLEGLAAGLAAIADRAAVAYVSSVDVPLLRPDFVRFVAGAVGDGDAAVPDLDGHLQPLAAAYRVGVRDVVAELLAEDRLALGALLERCRVRRLSADELPSPYSVMNLNDPVEYQRALALRAPGVVVGDSVIPAWRLGDVLGDHRALTLNKQPVDPDPDLPLVAGDEVEWT